MKNKQYCGKCGLEFRNWAFKIENPACEECEPEKYERIYKDNITTIKKRTLSQEHITEHTFFPGERVNAVRQWWSRKRMK